MILRREEQSGNVFYASQATEFNNVIDSLDLIDLPLLGGQ